MLKEKIQSDLKEAMKARNELVLSTLRMVATALTTAEIIKERKALTEEEVMGVLKREVKQRQDAITDYKKGGREDLAKKEKDEIVILQKYLPAAMSEEKVRTIVEKVMQELQITPVKRDPSSPAASQDDALRHFGKVMKAVMAESKGRADGAMVSKMVKELLAGSTNKV
jgi:hypothetical protein